MPTSRPTVPIFPFEISHCQRQWSHLIENRFANLQGQNNNSIKSLSHPSQTTEVEMKISCLCTSDMFLTQQSASHHPPSTWAKGTICSQQPEKSFCYFANLQKKKRTPSAWLCVKREFAENFHMFVSPCVNFQCCSLSGVWELVQVSNWVVLPIALNNMVQTYQPTDFVKHWPWIHRHFANRIRRTKISVSHRIFPKKG